MNTIHETYNDLFITLKANLVPLLSTLSLTINVGTFIQILVKDVAPPFLIICSLVISILTIYTLVQKIKLNKHEIDSRKND